MLFYFAICTFIYQIALAGDSEVTLSVFDISCHLFYYL